MRDYGKVAPTFWTGETGRKLREIGRDEQLIALFLITNPNANMIGVYHLPLAVVAHYLGMNNEGALKGLLRVCESGFCRYDAPSECVFIPEMACQQIGEPLHDGDKRLVAIKKEFCSMRKSIFYKDFFDRYGASYGLELASPFQAPSKPGAGARTGAESESGTRKSRSPSFSDFWKEYPRKQDRDKAEEEWTLLCPSNELFDIILASVAAHKKSGIWDDVNFVPFASRWLRDKRWSDEVIENKLEKEQSPTETKEEQAERYRRDIQRARTVV